MKKLLPLLITSFLAWLPDTDAQLTISGENAVVCANGTVSIDVSVSNFIDITSAQFGVTWDTDVVQFSSVSNNMPASALYNTVNAATGQLRFSWFDANPPPGYTPPGPPVGSQILFTINFNIVGNYSPDDFTPINIGSVPGFTMEIASTSGIIPNGNIVINPGSVTLEDNIVPVITCPSNMTVTAVSGQPSAIVNYAAPSVTDNCDMPASAAVCSPPSGSAFLIGTTTVNCTATDNAGNSANCAFTVTVNPPPPNPNALWILADDFAIVCNDTAVNVPVRVRNFTQMTSAQFALVWDELVLEYTGHTDSLNATGHNTALYNFSNAPSGEFRFSWFDADGVPGEDLPDSTVIFTMHFKVLDENELPDTVVITGVPGYPVEFSNTSGILGPGDYAFNDAIISVVPDTIPPSITCPTAQTLNADASCEAILLDYTSLATATDNCSAPMDIVITQFPAAGTVITDTTEVMLIAEDEAGLFDTCYFDVNLVDTTDPVAVCPASIPDLMLDTLGMATLPANIGDGSSTDNCSVMETSPAMMFTCADIGVQDVILTATDASGNSSTATCSFNVVDDIIPVANCPANIPDVLLDAMGVGSLPANIGDGSSTDNCSVTETSPSLSFTCADIGVQNVVLTATDASGNSSTATCSFNVVDGGAPFITCPADTIVDIDMDSCNAVVILPAATASDSCSTVTISDDLPMGNIFPAGTTMVTYTATDTAGNMATCQVMVTVNDTIPPVITCPANIMQGTDPGTCSAVVTWAMPTVVDNCTNVTITCTPPSGTTFPVGDSTVVCIVEDPGGNLDTCEFIITVFDDEAPSLQCPTDTLILVPVGTLDTIVNDISLFSISDNCTLDTSYYHFSGAIPNGGGTGNDASGTVFPIGTTTVTYFGVDAVGNIDSCAFNVTIMEDAVITITCSPDQTLDNDPGLCGALVSGVTASVQPLASVQDTFYQISGATIGNGVDLDASGGYNGGISTVEFFAVSIGGDTVSCTTTITINDVDAPVFTNCPSGTVTVNNTTDECGVLFQGAIVPVATDNCPGVMVNYSFSVGSLVPVGTNTIVANATDGAGNVSSCVYTLEVIDNQPPKFLNCTHGASISRVNDPNECGAVVAFGPVVTAQDNCSLLAFTETVPGNGDFFPVGNTNVTYTAVDDKGNVATCALTVTVSDTQLPTISCPGNQPPVNTDLNQCSASVNFPMPSADDNCSVISFGPVTPAGPVFAEGVHTVTYVASDAAGNMATCSFTVTVVDNQFPFIPNFPPDLTVYSNASNCGANAFWAPPSSPIDNCGIDTFGPSGGAPGDFFAVGDHEVKYVAMDVNGNITVKTLNITVLDTLPPTINCPTGVSISVDGGTIDDPSGFLTGSQQVDCDNIELDYAALMASDACGISSMVQTAGLPSGSPFPVGNTMMSFLATDNNGNTSTCSFTVSVVDYQIAPASVSQGLVCEGGTVTFSVGTLPGATYTWTTNGNSVSNMPTFTITNATLQQSGIYTVVVSTAYCDITFTTELNVSAVPAVAIDANDILCASNGLPLVLTGQNASVANVTNWTWTFPNGSMPTGQTQSIMNPTPANSGTYCVTATTAFGCSASACEQVTVNVNPPMPVLTGTTSTACLGTQFTLFGQLYTGNSVQYKWYATPAVGSGLTSVNNPITTPQPTAAGTYTYHFYVEVDGCISDTAEWVVVVEAAPTIDLEVIGATQCVDGTSNVTLTDNGTGATSWMWMGPLGQLPGNTASVVLQNVTPAFTGIYKVTAKTAIGCTSTDEVQLTFTAAPAAPQLTASETTICEGNFVTLTGTQYNGVVNYIWIGSGVPPNTQGQNQIDVFPTQPGTFVYEFAAFVNGCFSDTAEVTVTVSPAPVLNIDVVGDLDCVDGNGTVSLSATTTGLSNIEWTDAAGNVVSNANPLVFNGVTSASSGTYFLSATNAQGCVGYGSANLAISDGIDGLTASSSMADCATQSVTLEASTIANASYAWFKPNSQRFATTQNTSLAGANDGTYTVVAQVNGCSDTATVAVNLPNTLEANDKIVVCIIDQPQGFNMLAMDVYEANQPFTINILQQPSNGIVTYFGDDSIYTYTPNPGFWGNDFIIYEICYTACPDLCSVAKVTFQVKPDPEKCVITTVISPNDDGYNDVFIVSCVEDNAFPSNKLHIYNEWGDEVFQAAPYKNDWKGTHNGKDLPDGTYFFIFQRDPDTPARKGFVMIYR